MLDYKVQWTNIATTDLKEIINYISNDSKVIAKQKYIEIKSAATTLNNFPQKGRVVPELQKQNIEKYREIIIPPWRLVYRIEKNIVYVLALIDGRRNIEDILLSRNLR